MKKYRTVEEIRRINLQSVVKKCGGMEAFLELMPNRNRGYFDQISNASIHSGTKKPRTMGSDVARAIEEETREKLNLEDGWFDHDHSFDGRLEKLLDGQTIVPIVTDKYFLECDAESPSENHVFTTLKFKGQGLAFVVKKNDMSPSLGVNDLVIIDTGIIPDSDQKDVVLFKYKDSILLRNYTTPEEGEIELMPQNKDYAPLYTSNKHKFYIFGVVVEHRKYLKK